MPGLQSKWPYLKAAWVLRSGQAWVLSVLNVSLTKSFASSFPSGTYIIPQLLYSLGECLLKIYQETSPLLDAEDTLVNKTHSSPRLTGDFSPPFLYPALSVEKGESEHTGSTLQTSKCISP